MLFSEHEMRGYWPWPELEAGAYDFIMADPPWSFELWSPAPRGRLDEGESHGAYQKSPQSHYATMTLDDIKRLSVAGLAASDCLLWLWATALMLHEQIAVLDHWGFAFKTSGVWVKTTVNNKIGFGTGYVLRNAHEPFLIGTRGNPVTSRSVRSVVMGRVREHSQKPEESYLAAEALMPGARRVELFSRTNRPGWQAWGNETGLFGEATATGAA
ncbi:MAG TPA: MT-A70 family methyltransferase [Hyphomicrobium sp.]|nr:MT-A70 family methyltransferase [Hyphomicrobium sp.]